MGRYVYIEKNVINAIFDITEGSLSQHQASDKYGVPQPVLSKKLSGQKSRKESTHPHQRVSTSQEDRLIRWLLRQESLGYALTHSQLRSCVEALLRQQGDNKPLGKSWTTRFIKRHSKLSTKLGKRQEAAKFDGFTPKAVNWYFDIRENGYGWIKPENTVNVDEGGIMAGFGLENLIIGSSDPKKKALLKGVQSCTWTSFIEAITATGRALKPGIIFKGKELQKQWFLNEFALIADWHYITSPNGWTDNHIALEWLKDVYLPQTEPRDASDARLIILDGHGSHAQNARITGLEEQMAQVRRGRKRKAVPNPNRRFMTLAEALATGEALQDTKEAEIEVDVDEKVESVIEVGVGSEDEREDFTVVTKHYQRTRSGREVKKPRRE
ncbi:hypothetical protein BFJ63_vAg17206 [Fusarium oxysporum f. sp. narcissi]|uniref:HTH CENPB-type domain-containing protein n=1 Tax=Fusarium oxysporum f. sp. narcissi TaxID=451672 RepID=A0A4Q2V0B2_FUSOX|nr:hypothetical protein BFJ63_vAg17206 [Fusarium oxysporum f. sp. narcissi]